MHCREEFHSKGMNTESTPFTRTYFALQQTHADREKNRRIHRQQTSAVKKKTYSQNNNSEKVEQKKKRIKISFEQCTIHNTTH